MQPLIAKWQPRRMTISGSRPCSASALFSRCGMSLHVPVTRLLASRGASRPPISASPKVQRPRRRRDPSVGPSSTRGLEEHDGSGCSSCSTGAEIAAAPSRVACSRSLLGQSVTRQVGAAGRSIAPSSQVLPVIPMPGGERSWRKGRQPYFCSNCSFLATAAWAGSAASNKRVSLDILQTGMASCCSSPE